MPDKAERIPSHKRQSESAEVVANDNVESSAANDNEHIEGSHEGMVGNIVETIIKAEPNTIIVVSGLEHHEYRESLTSLAGTEGVTLVDKEKGENADIVSTQVEDRIKNHPDKKIVADMPDLLKNMLFPASATDSESAHVLGERSHYDPADVLLKWVGKAREEAGEDETKTAEARLAQAFEDIRALTGKSERDVMLALPADSPLVLAYLTFAKYKNLSPDSIHEMRKYIFGTGSIATILMKKNKDAKVLFGSHEVV